MSQMLKVYFNMIYIKVHTPDAMDFTKKQARQELQEKVNALKEKIRGNECMIDAWNDEIKAIEARMVVIDEA
jgi:ribonucleotide reductase alpha subunit